MQTAALLQRLTAGITADGRLTLDSTLLPEAGSLAGYLSPGAARAQVVIGSAKAVPGSNPATVTGTATLLGQANLPVTLTAQGDDQSTMLTLTATGIDPAWRLPSSLGTLPQYWAADGSGGLSLQDSFFDGLAIRNASFVVATGASADGTIQPGLNLTGAIAIDSQFGGGLLADVLQVFKGSATVPLSGTIALASGQPPVIDLRARLDPSPSFHIASLSLEGAFLWLRTMTPPGADAPVSRMDLAMTVKLGTPKAMDMIVSSELVAGIGRFGFWGTSEDGSFSLANGLADLTSLLGQPAGSLSFPATLDQLSGLFVRQVGAVFSIADGPQLLSVTLAFPSSPAWTTPIPDVSVSGVETEWTVSFGAGAGVDGTVSGVIGIGKDHPVALDVKAEFPDFTLSAALDVDESGPLPVSDAVAQFVEVPDLPAIELTALSFEADPKTGDLSLSGMLSDPWPIPLGTLTTFSIPSAYFTVNRSSSTGFSGSIGGDGTIASATLSGAYAFPGSNFTIDGKIPSIPLSDLIGSLCSQVITLPDDLNFALTDAEVAITKAGSAYTFVLQTGVPYGSLFFELLNAPPQGWGAAVGVDLSAIQHLGDVKPFGFLNQIDLTLERMILVLTSVDLPSGYTFPAVPSAAGGSRVTIPASIGTPKQGVNFYGAFAFGDCAATRHQPLLNLYDFFRIQRVDLDVAVQISDQGGSTTALLMAGASSDGSAGAIGGGNAQHHMTIAGYLGIKYTAGNTDVFVNGQLTLDRPQGKPGETLTFTMELDIEQEGFSVAGSMVGSWAEPFGVKGLTVSDVAVEVGADWDGIPTIGFAGTLTEGPFNGSIACVLNSIDPNSSVLAGSLSDVRLGEVARTFVGSSPDPAGTQIVKLLDQISIGGVGTFTLPASLAPALDAGDLAKVAAAFQAVNLPLTPTPQAMLLVVATPGKAWFVTDRINVKHYELTLADGQLTARLEAQLYIAPNAATIASMAFRQGYQVYGSLNLFGFTEKTAVTIAQGQGVAVDVRLSPIDLFDHKLQVLRAPGDTTGDGQDDNATKDGPYVSLATFSQPSLPAPFSSPHFFVSGAFSFLGMASLVIDIAATEQGLQATIDRSVGGTDLDLAITFNTSPLSLSGGGSAALSVAPKIDLKAYQLGTYTVATTSLQATLTFGLSGAAITARGAADFSFDVPAFGAHLGPYHLDRDLLSVDQPLAQLQGLFEQAIQQVPAVAKDLYAVLKSDADKFTTLVNEGVITLDQSLDSVLQNVFNVTSADVKATDTCFASKKLVPHMAKAAAAAGAPAESDATQLDRLRSLRADLETFDTGRWIVNVYNTISQPLVNLYDYKPGDPNEETLVGVLDVYDGASVFAGLQAMLQSGTITDPDDLEGNGMAIVSGVIDAATAYQGDAAPGTRQYLDGQAIVEGVTALLDLLSNVQGLTQPDVTYQSLLNEVKGMATPPNPFSTPSARPSGRAVASAPSPGPPSAVGAPKADSAAPATQWESLVTTVVDNLIASLPDILRNGYQGDGVTLPSYSTVALPDTTGVDPQQKLALCNYPDRSPTAADAATKLSLRDVQVSGLDSVAQNGSITFPVQDVEISVPLVFSAIVVKGNWETHSPCQQKSGAVVDTIHSGTFAAHFASVQVTLDVRLDANVSTVTAASLTLADSTASWSSQPTVAPADLTFDSTTSAGQRSVLSKLVTGDVVKPVIRDGAKACLEGPELAGAIRTVMNDALGQLA